MEPNNLLDTMSILVDIVGIIVSGILAGAAIYVSRKANKITDEQLKQEKRQRQLEANTQSPFFNAESLKVEVKNIADLSGEVTYNLEYIIKNLKDYVEDVYTPLKEINIWCITLDAYNSGQGIVDGLTMNLIQLSTGTSGALRPSELSKKFHIAGDGETFIDSKKFIEEENGEYQSFILSNDKDNPTPINICLLNNKPSNKDSSEFLVLNLKIKISSRRTPQDEYLQDITLYFKQEDFPSTNDVLHYNLIRREVYKD